MNPATTAVTTFACLVVAIALGMRLRRRLPDHHLSADSKDAVKLAMGLVATMTALVLGLLVSSAKGSYDTARSEILQMAAKVAFLDRVMALYGPEAADARTQFRMVIEDATRRMWPDERGVPPQVTPNVPAGDAIYVSLQHLSPQDDAQRSLKAQATTLIVEVGQLRSLLQAQSVPSISQPLLSVVVCWLVVLFLSFSLIAPPNATTAAALIVSAFSVAGAVFLILELDQPLGGLIRISSEPMLNVLQRLGT